MDEMRVLSRIKALITGEWANLEPPVAQNGEASPDARTDNLARLREECGACVQCELYQSATNLVFGDGDIYSPLVFIGEAPGADEDAQGIPFVGKAGQLLNKTLKECGFPREKIYICNILKHRPPQNRDPNPLEVAACTPLLTQQIDILSPKLLITLGNFATKFICNTEEGITRMRGSITQSFLGYAVLPTYHPAAILRNMNLLEVFTSDIKKAIEYISR